MQDFKKLRVWHQARLMALQVVRALPIRAARKVPGLRSQAVRAATSVGANLVEGCARATRTEFLHFTEIALGSLNELEAHLLLARDANVIAHASWRKIQRDIDRARRMLLSLIRTLQRRIAEDESTRRGRMAEPR
jgi:four helix bundle protein